MMKVEKALSELDLNSWESKTYLGLLELGSTTTGPLVKKSGVPQSKIYEVLNSLNKKGLVSYIIKDKTKHFIAKSPEILLSLIKDKEKKIQEIMPHLKQLELYQKTQQTVELYEGTKGINTFFANLIETAENTDEWMGFSANKEDEFSEKGQLFWNKIGILRDEKKIPVKIMNNKKHKKDYIKYYNLRWKYIKKIIRFSNNLFPATTIIFRNKIIILNFSSHIETAIVITSSEMFKIYKEYFLSEWQKAI